MGNGCNMVYLDLGTNIGIQIRKLYEPHKYTNAMILPYFDNYFGIDLEGRKAVCSFGFEPNPNHAKYLKFNENQYLSMGYRVKIFTETAVGNYDGEASLVSDNSFQHFEWGAKIGQKGGQNTIQVTMLNFPRWFQENIVNRNYTGESTIVMKVDIEGFEWTIFPEMIRFGLICYLDFIYVEHLSWDVMKSINDVLSYSGCKTRIIYLDDETYFNMIFPFPSEE